MESANYYKEGFRKYFKQMRSNLEKETIDYAAQEANTKSHRAQDWELWQQKFNLEQLPDSYKDPFSLRDEDDGDSDSGEGFMFPERQDQIYSSEQEDFPDCSNF